MKSSIGIRIIGWAHIIGVLLLWLWFFVTKLYIGNPWALYFLIHSIVILVSAIGLLLLKNWARLVMILICSLKAIEVFYKLGHRLGVQKSFGLEALATYLSTLVPCLFIIWFLNKKSAKEQFKKI